MGSCCLPLNQLTHPTMKTYASLIVMVSSACCAQINFLGVPGVLTEYSGYPALSVVPLGVYGAQPTVYTAETVSPSIYPLRTALDSELLDTPSPTHQPSSALLNLLQEDFLFRLYLLLSLLQKMLIFSRLLMLLLRKLTTMKSQPPASLQL